jgi:hypothetical protein
MFARTIVAAAIPLVPCHDLLILRSIRTERIANAARGRVEGCEVCRLTKAGPYNLICARKAAACCGGLVKDSA